MGLVMQYGQALNTCMWLRASLDRGVGRARARQAQVGAHACPLHCPKGDDCDDGGSAAEQGHGRAKEDSGADVLSAGLLRGHGCCESCCEQVLDRDERPAAASRAEPR